MAESDNKTRPLVIKRKKVIAGGGHHGGAWKVAMFCPFTVRSRRSFAPMEDGALMGPCEASSDDCAPVFGGTPPDRVQRHSRAKLVNRALTRLALCKGF